MKEYRVNEIFFSLQGEGVRTGTANLFLRFAGCTQHCTVNTHGFNCDTEFETGRMMTMTEIVAELRRADARCSWVILTGGEPALQTDEELIAGLHEAGYQLAIETNGTIELPPGLDWVTVSPKTEENGIRQRVAHEVKYVCTIGQPIPQTTVKADYYLISPAFDGLKLDPETLRWCIDLVQANPPWRLSVQMHKILGIS